MISTYHELWDQYFDACRKQEVIADDLRRGWHTDKFSSASDKCLIIIRSISRSELPKSPPTDIEKAVLENPGIPIHELSRFLKQNIDSIRASIRSLPAIHFVSQGTRVGLAIPTGDPRRYRYMGREDQLNRNAESWNKWFGNVDPYLASQYLGMGIDKLQRVCADLGLVRRNTVINNKSVVVYRKEHKDAKADRSIRGDAEYLAGQEDGEGFLRENKPWSSS